MYAHQSIIVDRDSHTIKHAPQILAGWPIERNPASECSLEHLYKIGHISLRHDYDYAAGIINRALHCNHLSGM